MQESYSIDEVVRMMSERIDAEFKQLKKMNIMLVGKTGSGKSTVVNNLFSEKLAKTGVGKPVTQEIKKYEKDGFPLAVYDTPGLELGGENAVDSLFEQVSSVIHEGIDSGDINSAIHCIVYCVSSTSHRIEQTEIDFLDKLNKCEDLSIPVILALTQSFNKKETSEFRKEIVELNLGLVDIIPVLAEEYYLEEFNFSVPPYGLKELAELIYKVIPESVRKTFAIIQTKSIKLKKDRAHAVVAAAALAAAAIGASPIPFSDAALLVPDQVAMLASITVIFGQRADKAALQAVIYSTIGTTGTTILGKTIVSSLLKMIPGVGTVAGAVISSTTAASLTAALGEAYIQFLVGVLEGKYEFVDILTSEGKNLLGGLFKSALAIKRDKDGMPIE